MAIGDIGALIDSLEWDVGTGNMPSVCHVDGDVYAVAYYGVAGVGQVCTLAIDATGNIGAAIIDTYVFEAVSGAYPEIVKVHDTIYAVVYTNATAKGQVSTLAIANDGTITAAVIATAQFSADGANPYAFIKITSNIFAVVFTDSLAHGWVQTINISNAGTITDASIDTLEFDGVTGREGSICLVSGNVYAIAYRGPGDDGWVCTLSIDALGAISNAVIDTLEFDIGTCVTPSIVQARLGFFAIAYSGPGADGWIVSVAIDATGNIAAAVTDSYEFDTITGQYPYLLALGQGYLAMSFTSSGAPLYFSTFLVDALGKFNATTIDTALIDAVICTHSLLLFINGDYYAIFYCGLGGDGWVQTITVETPVEEVSQHLMMVGIG